MGDGVGGYLETIHALAVDGGEIYAGGDFLTTGEAAASHVARWNGATWSALAGPSGAGVTAGSVRALAVYDDGNGTGLYVGGQFETVGGVTVNNIARWDGATWHAGHHSVESVTNLSQLPAVSDIEVPVEEWAAADERFHRYFIGMCKG